jgi:predicted PolB exonuclease-like 3'-5' exonuclease
LASFSYGAKVKLDEITKIIGLPGKPPGLDGTRVQDMVSAGQIGEVSRYCETDVLNTYRVWLLYELFRGALTSTQANWSERQIREFVLTRKMANPYLQAAVDLVST